jgi:prepilin-type N-terminal cleavage/methylation domain-containing protein
MKKGFTLVEVMAALAILAIAICGLSSMFFATEHMNRFDADRIQAFKLAHQTMENLLSMGVNDIKTYDGKTFTDVNNRTTVATKSDLGTLDDADYDQGIPPDSGSADINDFVTNYEPTPMTGPATTTVTVTDLNWGASYQAVLIEVAVPEFGVTISAVKTDVQL